ncbi:hypothetical protein SAMN05444404_3496 [Ruegeria lacuscaerulensis ITI-1157]|nr:hypothetical protein SAMN05444404_3496 [Ruegeria lacuscaerulensis ITI-1157]
MPNTTKPASMEALMEELCDLLRQVLGRGADAQSSARINELLSEIGRIRVAMERQTENLEAIRPGLSAFEAMSTRLENVEKNQQQMLSAVEWFCRTLGHPAFHEDD